MNRHTPKRLWRGLKLGLLPGRSEVFVAPESIRVRGQRRHLRLPREKAADIVFSQILLDDVYGLEQLPGLGRVLDVGANVGLFTVAVKIRHPRALTHAYEPNRRLAPYLDGNTSWTGAVVYYEAISATAGSATLKYRDETVRTTVKRDDQGPVRVTSLRQALDRLGGHADLLKLDCEGCEWELLDDHEPWQRIQHVAMEYHRDRQAAIEKLQALGYRIDHAEATPRMGVIRASRESR